MSQEYPPGSPGGIGTQTYMKAHGLSALGHEVTVVSASMKEVHCESWDGPVRVIHICGFDRRMPLNTELARWQTYSAEAAAAVSALHSEKSLDIVDFPEWGCEGHVHLLNRTEWYRIPTVIQLHGPLVMFAHNLDWPLLDSEFYRLGSAMEGTCLRLADAVYSSSNCSADWCARHYGLPRERIPTIHTGVDTHLFAPDGSPKEVQPTVVFVGGVKPTKGVGVLVNAALMLRSEFPSLQVQIIGAAEPEYQDALLEQSQSGGHSDLLHFAGKLSAPAIAAQLRRAHVFAAPSRYEGGPGFVYLEAMACGLPVIACENSGTAEVIQHGRTGFLIPPGDPMVLCEVLRKLLLDSDLRRRMGASARSYVKAEADSDICVKRLESFYRSVVEGSFSLMGLAGVCR